MDMTIDGVDIREINFIELKQNLKYEENIDVLLSEKCPRGYVFFLRKSHLGATVGIGLGADVVIGNIWDFGEDFLTERDNDLQLRVV